MSDTIDTAGLAARIELQLKRLGISAREASLKSGGNPEVIRNILRAAESGRPYHPRSDTLAKLARVLGVTPNWLLSGDHRQPPPLIRSFDPDQPGEPGEIVDVRASARINDRRHDRGLSPGAIPEIDTVLGAGGGGYPLPHHLEANGRSYAAEVIRDEWVLPPRFLRDELRVDLNYVDMVAIRGDSMTSPDGGGYRDGDRVLINRLDTTLRQGGIFAIRESSETIIKQVELIRDTDPPRIRCTSLNPSYSTFELVLDGSAEVIGRVALRVTRV